MWWCCYFLGAFFLWLSFFGAGFYFVGGVVFGGCHFLGWQILGRGVFRRWAVYVLGLFSLWCCIFWAGRFLIFGRSIFSVFGILPSFASSYRFIFACFGCFLWLVCRSARLLCVAYFSFFKGSWLDYSCQLCFVCVIYILYVFLILSLAFYFHFIIF